jgi:hypothetical protein
MTSGIVLDYLVTGGFVSVVVLAIATYTRVGNFREDTEKKFEARSKEFDNRYVSRDICKILHEQTAADIAEIKCDVKKLLTRNGIHG